MEFFKKLNLCLLNRIGYEHLITLFIVSSMILTPCYLAGFNVYNIKSIYALISIGVGMLICGLLLLFKKLRFIQYMDLAFMISLVCGVEAILTIVMFIHTRIPLLRLFSYESHFDNIAGTVSCLCLSLPYSLYLSGEKNWIGNVGKTISIIMVVAIICTGSRSGVLCASIILLIYSCIKFGKKRIVLYSLPLTFIFTILLYFLRPDSANGRILIWKSLIPMLSDVPILGMGIHGFRKYYMDYQAEYLCNHPQDPYSQLADNVLYPFNEFIHLYICFGVVGILTVLFMLFMLFRVFRKNPDDTGQIAVLTLLSIAILSFFSYPFNYPFTYFIVGAAFLPVFKNLFSNHPAPRWRVLTSIMAIVIGINISFASARNIHGIKTWKDAYMSRNLA